MGEIGGRAWNGNGASGRSGRAQTPDGETPRLVASRWKAGTNGWSS